MAANPPDAQGLAAQVRQFQGLLQTIEEQLQETTLALQSVEEANDLPAGTEAFVPLTNGIYVKASLQVDKRFLVNVGNGVVTAHDAASLRQMLEEQLEELAEAQQSVVAQLEEAYQHYLGLSLSGGDA